MLFKLFNFMLFIMIACAGILPGRFAGACGPQDINRLMDRSNNLAKKIKIKPDKNLEAGLAAKKAARAAKSMEFTGRIKSEIKRIKHSLFSGQIQPDRKYSLKNKNRKYRLLADERIYLFISSSVPLATLKNYASDIDKLKDPNIIMVMRGFVKGMHYIRPTTDFVRGILTKNSECDFLRQKCEVYNAAVNVDPMLFTLYKINTVPTIVYAAGVLRPDPGRSEDAMAENAWKVSGDVPLEYALDKLRKQTKSSQLESIIRQLRRGFY